MALVVMTSWLPHADSVKPPAAASTPLELTNGCADEICEQVYAHSTLNHWGAPIFGSTNPVVSPESTPLFRQ